MLFKDCQELLTDSSAKKLMMIFLNFLTELVCTHIDISLLNYINGSLLGSYYANHTVDHKNWFKAEEEQNKPNLDIWDIWRTQVIIIGNVDVNFGGILVVI